MRQPEVAHVAQLNPRLEDGGERQPPRGPCGVSMRGEQRSKGLIREPRLSCSSESQLGGPVGKRGTGDTHCVVRDGLDRHRAKPGIPLHLFVRP
jgi:hypothetical protein